MPSQLKLIWKYTSFFFFYFLKQVPSFFTCVDRCWNVLLQCSRNAFWTKKLFMAFHHRSGWVDNYWIVCVCSIFTFFNPFPHEALLWSANFSEFSGYLCVLLLHLCPVCALKVMFPGLHAPLIDGMKDITAPRGALHQYNSPELTSSAAYLQCCVIHTVTETWAQRGLMDNKTFDLKEDFPSP